MSGDQTINDIGAQIEARKQQEAEQYSKKLAAAEEEDDGITSQFALDCLNANELGDGILFAGLNKNKYLYNATPKAWLCWSGHHWEKDELNTVSASVETNNKIYANEAKQLTDKIINSTEDQAFLKSLQKKLYTRISHLRGDRRRQNCLRFACSNPVNSLAVTMEQFDKNPWIIACKNAVIELRTGNARPGRSDDYVLKASPVEWKGISEPAPIWELFLNDIFEGNQSLIAYMGRLLGYAIAGLCNEHIFVIFTGQGRNGKGALIDTLIKHVLGPLAAPIQAEMLLSQRYSRNAAAPSPDIMALQGLRIAFASETDEDRFISPSRVKWLTGGDVLVGRSPNDKYETTFIPTHTLILSTNHIPHASSDDFAFWERIHLIPFNLSFVDRKPVRDNERRADKTLPDRLKNEASGILAWLVRGCLQWQEQGLNPPPIVIEATRQYQRKEDILSDFVDECLIEDPSSDIQANQLYEIFKAWWEENMSKNPWSVKKFGLLMTKRYKKEKHGTYIYYGICAKNRFGQSGRLDG